MAISSKQINQAIKRKTGLDGQIFCKAGSAHFYSDIDPVLNDRLMSKANNCIFVCYLNHQTIDEWVNDFINVLNGS